jgi:BirA family transcriptional regulator, biotin operon repressor / biotin---[acetyl-CoA-carboxylase] ligase
VTDDRLSESLVRESLLRLGIVSPVVVHPVTGSTNDDAKALASAGCEAGLVVVADAQSRGRGRHGNVWHSPAGQCLYFSLVLRPSLRPEDAAPFTVAAGVEVARAIEELCPHVRCALKWPNDVGVVAEDSALFLKLSGVLVESIVRGAAVAAIVVGVGVNVRLSELPASLQGLATSLHELGAPPLRCELAARLARNLGRAAITFERCGLEPWLGDFAERDVLFDADVLVGDVAGRADGIQTSGALRIATPGAGVRVVESGHVAWDRRARVRPRSIA